jgi:hypothetical protein
VTNHLSAAGQQKMPLMDAKRHSKTYLSCTSDHLRVHLGDHAHSNSLDPITPSMILRHNGVDPAMS